MVRVGDQGLVRHRPRAQLPGVTRHIAKRRDGFGHSCPHAGVQVLFKSRKDVDNSVDVVDTNTHLNTKHANSIIHVLPRVVANSHLV